MGRIIVGLGGIRLLFNKQSQAACVGARTGGTVQERLLRGVLRPEESVQDSKPLIEEFDPGSD